MPEPTQEEKIKIFEKLPKELRELMESENTGAFLLYLGGKYNLSDEKISALSKIVGNVILGITTLSNLISEIASKLAIDSSTASQIFQEINKELLASVANLLKGLPAPIPIPAAPIPTPQVGTPTSPQANVRADRYREQVVGGLEVIDLRKTPPPPMPTPVAAAPIPPRPLTFTKPIEPTKPTSLIEAEPHKITPPIAVPPRPPVVNPSTPLRTDQAEPQYIIRPPGLAPADLPHDVLDLRRDKGEF